MHGTPPILKIILLPLLILTPFYTVLTAQADYAANTIACINESNDLSYNDFVSGSFKTQYEGRWAEGEEDHDMYEYLRFKTKDFLNNKVTISGSGRVSEDLDGHEPQTGAFRDILDTNDSSVNERLYYLYADIKNPFVNQSSLRVGRQYQYSLETILLDGAKYEQRVGVIDAYVFGGLRASQYSSTYFDTVVGSGVAVQPFMTTRTNLDYVRIIDDNFIDDEVGVNLWQRIYEDVNFYGKYTLLNTHPKDFLVRLSWDKIDWDASVQASYFRFFRSISDQSNNFSPYYQIMGTFEPFDIVSLTGYKGLGEKFGMSSGIDHRSVISQSDENNFNRSYNRTFLAFSARNVLLQESNATLTLEHWNTEGVDNSTDVGVDFGKKINKFDVGAGTSYSLYKYHFDGTTDMSAALNNEFTKDVEQKVNVRTYYLKVKYLLTKHSDVNMQWSTEISDTDPGTFHQLRLSYSTNF